MSQPVWVARSVVMAIHEEQIAEHGGLSGVRDGGLPDSALLRAPNAWNYGEEDLCELAALYAEGIAKNHPFADGNKRMAFLTAYTFLGANGLDLRATDEEATVMTLGLASGELPGPGYAMWLRDRTAPVPER